MNFENTEISQEDKKLLLMLMVTLLSFFKREWEDNENENVIAFCNTLMQLYEDNEKKLEEVFGDTCNEAIVKFALQNVNKLLQEF